MAIGVGEDGNHKGEEEDDFGDENGMGEEDWAGLEIGVGDDGNHKGEEDDDLGAGGV